ncbi:unnamed protein product [Gongylonema pulchrum]|uniref:Uncharacterized protein n=1 Tax=Gongylonema pulchrum TaxID=637853 RepID=A0A183EBK3_9BILA|nr:unnamed protein product [Gongylonema pulchrum]
MGVDGAGTGSSYVEQEGTAVTCKIDALLTSVSDAPIIVPFIHASSNVPKVSHK